MQPLGYSNHAVEWAVDSYRREGFSMRLFTFLKTVAVAFVMAAGPFILMPPPPMH
jgi:hypothetical protein